MPTQQTPIFIDRSLKGRCALLCLLVPAISFADVYSCKDSTGQLLTSDRPIPECADKMVRISKDNGVLINEIAPPLTPAQRQAADLQAQQRAKEASQKEYLLREQRFMVAHYPDEQSIEAARKTEIDALDIRIATEKNNIETATVTLEQTKTMLPNIPANNALKINETKMKIADLTLAIQESNHLIQNYQKEEVKINQHYDATHKRYVEIMRAGNH